MKRTVGDPSNSSLRGRALVIDQDVEYLEFVQRVVQGVGCGVQACNSYQEGIRQLSTGRFDVILVGQGSPEFEGRCVLERTTKLDRRLPVIVVARRVDIACYFEAMQLGAVDYIAGPRGGAEIAQVVKKFAPRSKVNVASPGRMSNLAPAKPEVLRA